MEFWNECQAKSTNQHQRRSRVPEMVRSFRGMKVCIVSPSSIEEGLASLEGMGAGLSSFHGWKTSGLRDRETSVMNWSSCCQPDRSSFGAHGRLLGWKLGIPGKCRTCDSRVDGRDGAGPVSSLSDLVRSGSGRPKGHRWCVCLTAASSKSCRRRVTLQLNHLPLVPGPALP